MASFTKHIEIYKALGDETRLRLLYLCAQNGLSIKDLMVITQQSQPRLSRHLKLMVQAHILNRVQEGNSVYFYLNRADDYQKLWDYILNDIKNAQVIKADIDELKAFTKIKASQAISDYAPKALNWERVSNKIGRSEIIDVHIKNIITKLKPQKLLDVGCGYGHLLGQVSPYVSQAYGLEPDVQMIHLARAHMLVLGRDNVVFYKSDISELSQYNRKYDCIIAHFFLHLIKGTDTAIQLMQQALADNGALIIVDICTHGQSDWAKKLKHAHYGFGLEQLVDITKKFALELDYYSKIEGQSLDAQILVFKRKI
ncbi:MAG: metalloregulator ArsR/SmtB family transcription factor [Alphaproteobacteria bacterium]